MFLNITNIFQMKHFSAVKFAIGYEKNMSFHVIHKSPKVFKKKLKRYIVGLGSFKEPSAIFSTFSQTLEILVSQESSFFSHNICKISQLKIVPFGRYQ